MNNRHKMRQVEKDTAFLPGRQLGRLAVLVVLLLCAGLLLWMFGPSAYRALKLGRLQGDAERLLEEGETGQAVLAAQTALLLDSENVRALDVLAQAAAREGSPMQLTFREQLAKIDPSPARSVDFARALLAAGRSGDALAALDAVPGQEREFTAFHNVRAAALLARGDFAGAKGAAERAAASSGNDPAALANLVVVLLHEPSDDSARRINEILGGLWGDAAFRLQMNRVLASVARVNNDLGTARELAGEVAAEPGALPADEVALLDVMAAVDPSEAAEKARVLLAEASGRPEEALHVAAWMLRQGGLAKNVSDWVDGLPEALAAGDSLRLTWADAMAQQQRWQEMFERMDKAEWGTADHARLAYLSRALDAMGNDILAGARWRQALRSASASPQFLWSLWAVSSQWEGWEEREIDLLWSLHESTRSPSMLARLASAYAGRGDAANLLRVARIAHTAAPDSFAASNNHAYLALLLGQDQQAAIEIAERNHQADPTAPPRVSTLALALCRDGRADEALALLDALPMETRNAPEFALVDAIVQADVGNRDAALAAVTRADTATMLDAERALLEETRARAEALPAAR